MLLDEDPATLIAHTVTNFSILPDKSALSRISVTLSTLSQSRSQRLHASQSTLNSLSRKVTTLNSYHSETVSAHDRNCHAEAIMELDAQKFRIAKAARDAEEAGERLEGELGELRRRLERLESEGPEGGERRRGGGGQVEDAMLLRLKLYRTLGIDFEPASSASQEGQNTLDRVIIRNMSKGDVHVVNIDPKFSRFFYANYLWSAMEG